MEGLKVVPVIFLMLAIVGVIVGAAAITLSNFGDNLGEKCWNSSYVYNETKQACQNNTDGGVNFGGGPYTGNLSTEFYTVSQGLEAGSEVSGQLPTVAIISVMVIIISLIAGVFVYMRYFG